MRTFVVLLGQEWLFDVCYRHLYYIYKLSTNVLSSKGLMRACELLEPEYLVQMLKAVKHLSMNGSLLDVLQNANSIEILVRILDEHSSGPHITVNR